MMNRNTCGASNLKEKFILFVLNAIDDVANDRNEKNIEFFFFLLAVNSKQNRNILDLPSN